MNLLPSRRFVRRTLLVYLLLLAALLLVLVLATRLVYHNFRDQAIRTVQGRQHLLALQTTRGIENYYQSIRDVLNLLGQWRSTPAATTSPAAPDIRQLVPLLWDQLQERASHLFVLDVGSWRVLMDFRALPDKGESTQTIAEQHRPWLQKAPARAVSHLVEVDGRPAVLVATRIEQSPPLLLVAVTPTAHIDDLYLAKLGTGNHPLSAMLLDQQGNPLAFSQPELFARQAPKALNDPRLTALGRRLQRMGASGQRSFETPLSDQPLALRPTIATLHPVRVGDHDWWLMIASSVSYVDTQIDHLFGQIAWWSLFVILSITALLVSSFITVLRGRLRLERLEGEVLRREIDQARNIQLAWLPQRNQCIGPVEVAAVNHPASHISGDFYNWFELDDGRLAVCIGDVTGHGMSAAFLMATTQIMTRALLMRFRDPGKAMEEINRQMAAQIHVGQFVTLLILVLDVANHRLEAAVAGHYPPLISTGGAFKSLPIRSQLMLGVNPDLTFPTECHDLPPDSSLLLYTDGVLDLQNPDGQRYDLEQLQAALNHPPATAQGLIERTVAALKAFANGRAPGDDLTLVAVRVGEGDHQEPFDTKRLPVIE